MKAKAALTAIALVLLSGCGGGGGESGGSSPQDVLACLKKHGLRAAVGEKNAADATQTVEVAIKDPPNTVPQPTFPPILYLDFFPDGSYAQTFIESAAAGTYTRRRIAETVAASYAPAWGLRGPPEIEKVRDCLGA